MSQPVAPSQVQSWRKLVPDTCASCSYCQEPFAMGLQDLDQILIKFYLFLFVLFVKKSPATRPQSRIVCSVLSHPLSSCSSRSSSSRSTTAAAGAIYSSSSSTRLPSAIYLEAASRVQAGMYHVPKCSLLSRLVCHVGRDYEEKDDNHVQSQRPLYFAQQETVNRYATFRWLPRPPR